MSTDVFTHYLGWIKKFIMMEMSSVQNSMREKVYLTTIRPSMWWDMVIQLQSKNYVTIFPLVVNFRGEFVNVWIETFQFTCTK